MVRNYRISLSSTSSMTLIALITSKFILHLEEYNKENKNVAMVVLSVNTSNSVVNKCEIIIQINSSNLNYISSFIDNIDLLLCKIEKEFNIKSEKILI